MARWSLGDAMNVKALLLGVTAAALIAGPTSAAVFTNGSFENTVTPFDGWSVSHVALTALDSNEEDNAGTAYEPTAGDRFARLSGGAGPNVYATLSQNFSIGALGGSISGDAAFLGFDYLPYNDDAYVRILNQLAETQAFFLFEPFAASIASTDPEFGYGSTPWTHFNQSLGEGNYVVEIGVRNAGPVGADDTNTFPSFLLVDNFVVQNTAVPEPATWALMIGGFGMTGSMLRRRRLAIVRAKAPARMNRG